MKKHTFKTAKALAAFLIFTAFVSTGVKGQASEDAVLDITTSIKVKEFTGNNVSLDFTAFNTSKSPYQLLIRGADGAIVYREMIRGQQYDKRFKLDLDEFEKFTIEIMQGEKNTDAKIIKVARRTEENVDVLTIQ
jgi:hypothetical protein